MGVFVFAHGAAVVRGGGAAACRAAVCGDEEGHTVAVMLSSLTQPRKLAIFADGKVSKLIVALSHKSSCKAGLLCDFGAVNAAGVLGNGCGNDSSCVAAARTVIFTGGDKVGELGAAAAVAFMAGKAKDIKTLNAIIFLLVA